MNRFLEALDVISDVCRDTGGARFSVVDGAQMRGYADRSFAPRGQMNHHTGRGSWAGLTNFITWGSSIAPLANAMTSNPYETDGTCIVQVTACGRANHAGVGFWSNVPQNSGNGLLWGWEHQHAGDASPWHPLQREVILRLNVALCLAFGWSSAMVMDHKEYATPPGRKVDRAHENGNVWRGYIQDRIAVGHHSGHAQKKGRTVELERMGGDTWFGTVALINKTMFQPGPETGLMFIVVRGTTEADRISGFATKMSAPWAEVERTGVPKETADLIRHFKPRKMVVLGGTNAVPEKVARECQQIAESA